MGGSLLPYHMSTNIKYKKAIGVLVDDLMKLNKPQMPSHNAIRLHDTKVASRRKWGFAEKRLKEQDQDGSQESIA